MNRYNIYVECDGVGKPQVYIDFHIGNSASLNHVLKEYLGCKYIQKARAIAKTQGRIGRQHIEVEEMVIIGENYHLVRLPFNVEQGHLLNKT